MQRSQYTVIVSVCDVRACVCVCVCHTNSLLLYRSLFQCNGVDRYNRFTSPQFIRFLITWLSFRMLFPSKTRLNWCCCTAPDVPKQASKRTSNNNNNNRIDSLVDETPKLTCSLNLPRRFYFSQCQVLNVSLFSRYSFYCCIQYSKSLVKFVHYSGGHNERQLMITKSKMKIKKKKIIKNKTITTITIRTTKNEQPNGNDDKRKSN